jgi:hypothetical protein
MAGRRRDLDMSDGVGAGRMGCDRMVERPSWDLVAAVGCLHLMQRYRREAPIWGFEGACQGRRLLNVIYGENDDATVRRLMMDVD